jgi:hypothetical protein
VIITVALGAMGSLPAAIHRAFNDGKVRPPSGRDFTRHRPPPLMPPTTNRRLPLLTHRRRTRRSSATTFPS